MTKKFYDYYNNRPPKCNTVLKDDTTFVSQSEVECTSLKYMLDRFGMNTLSARMEQMRDKFGYADCTVNNNFADIQNRYIDAVNYFNDLPAQVRRRYKDRAELFYDDLDKNPQTAYEAGFISKEKFEELVKPTLPLTDPVQQGDLTVQTTTSQVGDEASQAN